jgi:hypothetical protein
MVRLAGAGFILNCFHYSSFALVPGVSDFLARKNNLSRIMVSHNG